MVLKSGAHQLGRGTVRAGELSNFSTFFRWVSEMVGLLLFKIWGFCLKTGGPFVSPTCRSTMDVIRYMLGAKGKVKVPT